MVFFCVCVFVFCCYGSYSKIVIEPYETVAIASVLKIYAFSLCTLWVTAFKPFINFAKSFILDLARFHALVLVN